MFMCNLVCGLPSGVCSSREQSLEGGQDIKCFCCSSQFPPPIPMSRGFEISLMQVLRRSYFCSSGAVVVLVGE